ncbi:uncharacterized protein FIESC28_00284 [Fusarium coffeatum]|uniref:Zn(2)-C6 fungal-type domain-containing protein n=1 Tax=Fusarium coffeatum TaxID=231269 RepID=A0A366SED1_9HYPO|nr:uncharacterized protein FIESC28_00284 [Fusarium coffeatum]RBR27016.1 hypothetical protein FIESC28_00284 [Fusarium coffeatum]
MPPRRACDVCYKRKIQCLIKTQGEPCDWCESQGLTCTFDRVIQKDPNKRTTSDVVQELSQRVETLEEALQTALHVNAPARSASITLSDRPLAFPSPPSLRLGGSPVTRNPSIAGLTGPKQPYKLSPCQLGTNWYFKGIGILSERGRQWITYGSGERVFLENFDIFANPIGVIPPLSPPDQARALPAKDVMRHIVDAFFKAKTSTMFPILERSLFQDTIDRAYDELDIGKRAPAEACLWALTALVMRTTDLQQFGLGLEIRDCLYEATRLLTLNNGNTNLDSLQGTLLLWACQKMRGQCREASVTFTSACRMVCDLGGHFPLSRLAILPQHSPTFDHQTRLHIRRLFWICYCFDKDMSLRTDKPPLLSSDYCDVNDSEEPPWYNQSRDMNLAKIKENAVKMLCSPRAFKYNEGQLLARVRELDDELEEWRLSVDLRYRPRLSILSDLSFSMSSTMSLEDRTYLINLQLDYLFTIINIHTLVRKCGDLEENLPDDLHSVVHSSADLSIEASRSIFRILDTVVDFWKEDSVYIVSHFAPMAAMPLFMNILIHPLGNTADSDLQILSSISNITRKVPAERLPMEEIEGIREISEFVMELVRLSHSAAWKVKRGEREHDLDIIHS